MLYLHKPVNRWDKIPGVEEEEGEADDYYQAAQVQGCILHGVEPEAFTFWLYRYELTLKTKHKQADTPHQLESHKKVQLLRTSSQIVERKHQILETAAPGRATFKHNLLDVLHSLHLSQTCCPYFSVLENQHAKLAISACNATNESSLRCST